MRSFFCYYLIVRKGAQWILPASLLVAGILALHQFGIFKKHYPWSSVFDHPLAFDGSPGIDNHLDQEEALWFLGNWRDEGEIGPEGRWKATLEAFPNDPAVLSRIYGRMRTPDDYLEKASKLAPENGWFDFLQADKYETDVFNQKYLRRTDDEMRELEKQKEDEANRRRKERRRSRPRPGRRPQFGPQSSDGLYYRALVVDEEKIDLTIAALTRASEKLVIDPYDKDYLARLFAVTKPGEDVLTRQLNLILGLNRPDYVGHYQSTWRVVEHRLKALGEAGNKEEFVRIKSVIEKILWHRFDHTHADIELLLIRNQLRDLSKLVSEYHGKLELDEPLQPHEERIARFTEYSEARKHNNYDKPFNDEEISYHHYGALIFARNDDLRDKIDQQELRFGVLAEQAFLSWQFYLKGGLALLAAVAILRFISRWIKNSGEKPSRILIAFTVLIPLFGFLVFHYATPWGGFYEGPG